MNMWCVNENVRNVNERRMSTFNRKHYDLRQTASVTIVTASLFI